MPMKFVCCIEKIATFLHYNYFYSVYYFFPILTNTHIIF